MVHSQPTSSPAADVVVTTLTTIGGRRWTSRSDASPPAVISSTPPDTAPSHGHVFMTMCSGEDHGGRADLDVGDLHVNLADPSPETTGGRRAEESPDSLGMATAGRPHKVVGTIPADLHLGQILP
jgi:hypothetical protein